jgi:hypothetical protein
MVTIEPRPYGADMTPEERDALLSRVYVVHPGIVFYREIPVQTVESVDLMLERLYDPGCQGPTFIEVLDLATVTSPRRRTPLSGHGCSASRRGCHSCVIVEKNVVIEPSRGSSGIR